MSLVGLGLALVLLGGTAAITFERWPRLADWAFGTTVLAGDLLLLTAAVRRLAGESLRLIAIPSTLPGGPWDIELDALAAWFLVPTALVGAAATVFGVGYLGKERTHRSPAAAHAGLALLLAGMAGVLVARSAVLFLLVWEIMAVSAYLLIVFDHEAAAVRKAGLLYLVLTHVGTLALLIMFLVWGQAAPDLRFSSLAATVPALGGRAAVILLLATLGFGIKAGIAPLHVWLPGAHAAAPSHVSAVLSGVMLKMGVYGLLRVIGLLGGAPIWWAWLIFTAGTASAVLGVLWALRQHDLKRLLAYSSVENIGLVMVGLGLGTLGAAYHRPVVAALGYAAALYHVLNHALFKSLLFFAAGAVAAQTGTRELDRLGGLAGRMPRTTLLILIGSIAIIGLPPLNGFVGEWILTRGLLTAGLASAGALRFVAVATAAIGLVTALALACFARLAFVILLGERREVGRPVNEAPPAMTVPAALLAATCLGIALWPGLGARAVTRVAGLLPGTALPGQAPPPLGPNAIQAIGWFAGAILLLVPVAWALRLAVIRSRSRRSSATWGCAYSSPTPRMQYTASSFAAPILSAFACTRAQDLAQIGAGIRTVPDDRVLRGMVIPLWHRIESLAARLRPLQQGRVTAYLQYMVWTVLVLLGFLFLSARVGSR